MKTKSRLGKTDSIFAKTDKIERKLDGTPPAGSSLDNRVTIVIPPDQIAFLDRLCLDIRAKTGEEGQADGNHPGAGRRPEDVGPGPDSIRDGRRHRRRYPSKSEVEKFRIGERLLMRRKTSALLSGLNEIVGLHLTFVQRLSSNIEAIS